MELEDKRVKIFKEYIFHQPDFIPDANPSTESYSLTWKNEGFQGVRAIAGSEEFCYILSDGQKTMMDDWRANKVYVFDWQGEPLCKLHLDKDLEPVFVFYKLDDI